MEDVGNRMTPPGRLSRASADDDGRNRGIISGHRKGADSPGVDH